MEVWEVRIICKTAIRAKHCSEGLTADKSGGFSPDTVRMLHLPQYIKFTTDTLLENIWSVIPASTHCT